MRDRTTLVGALVAAALIAVGLSGCGGDSDANGANAADTSASTSLQERLDAVAQAVGVWRTTSSIEDALASAEAAANLIVGPGGPGYGDRDGDGSVRGETEIGLLPALDGANGLASALGQDECIARDVLGGSWSDPTARWETMLAAIDGWRPSSNTMPSLPSHPMRVVGWATFTIEAGSLEDAHEYAGHAALHVDISRAALDC